MVKKLLLTGAAGFIGSHFLEHILEKTDWQITCVSSWSHKGTPERIERALRNNETYRERVTVITHDLSVLFTETTKKRLGKFDYIVNFAADSHVERSIIDPVPFVQNNVNVALTMLEFAREFLPEVFVQISTDEVYGAAPNGVNHKEWSPILPSNPYSASKACQEAIAISYWRTYGVPVVITNTMNNFGETQDAEKFIAMVINKIDSGEVVPVHGTEDNIGSRFYLHARNHADAVLHILGITPTKYHDGNEVVYPDRYNVVGDEELNNLEVAKIVSELMNKSLKYELVNFHHTRPGHDRRYALDGSKLKSKGWSAPVQFKESLKKYIDWTLNNNIWK
jgi:dTDP-glucose 4,6-dehydratase